MPRIKIILNQLLSVLQFSAVALSLVLIAPIAYAQSTKQDQKQIVFVKSNANVIYQKFVDTLINSIEGENSTAYKIITSTTNLSEFSISNTARNADIIISVGTDAALTLAQQKNNIIPVYYTLIPDSIYDQIRKTNSPFTATFIDQPLTRKIQSIKHSIPNGQQIVSFVNVDTSEKTLSNIQTSISLNGLTPVIEKIEKASDSFYLINQLNPMNSVLLIQPGSLVVKKNVLPKLIQTAYDKKIPVIGFSAAHVVAGAFAALHSSFTQLAKQIQEITLNFLENKEHGLPPPNYPRYFTFHVNNVIGRSMGFQNIDATSIADTIANQEIYPIAPFHSDTLLITGSGDIETDDKGTQLIKGIEQTFNGKVHSLNKNYISYFLSSTPAATPILLDTGDTMNQVKLPEGTPYLITNGNTPPKTDRFPNTTLSTYVLPDAYFNQVKRMIPAVNCIRGVFSLKYIEHLSTIKQTANNHNITFVPYFADSYSETLRETSRLFKNMNYKTDAIWITNQVLKFDDDQLNLFYKKEAWRNRAFTFSSNRDQTRNGALFSLEPNYLSFGHKIGNMLKQKTRVDSSKYLDDYILSLNRVTAQHIGIGIPNPLLKTIDVLYP